MNQPGGYVTLGAAREKARTMPSDLLEGVLHTGTTIMYGASGVGKGRLIAELVTAGLDQQNWAGRRWTRPLERVAILATDVDPDREYGAYFDRTGISAVHDDAVRVYPLGGVPTAAEWNELVGGVGGWKPSLVVLDSTTEAVRGSVNDDVAAKELFAHLRPFHSGSQRVPLVLLHHVAKPNADSGGKRGRTPIGSGVWEGLSRSKIHVRDAYRTEGGDVTLELRPRESAPWEAHFTCGDDGRLIYSSSTTAQDRKAANTQRDAETFSSNMEVARYVEAECQGKNKAATARMVAERFPGISPAAKDRVGAIKGTLTRGRDFSALLDYNDDGHRWTVVAGG